MSRAGRILVWVLVVSGLAIPVIAASTSPYLQWRSGIYIAAGFAGIMAFVFLAVQPLLIDGLLPGVTARQNRNIHRLIGSLLVLLVIAHVGGLWWESPPDVIDALLFRSPTPFAVWGVTAMWAVFATALIAVLRKPLKLRPRTWRVIHKSLAVIIVSTSILHAYLVLGAMETITKIALCIVIALLTLKVVTGIRLRG